jgi:hypothetical protein
MERKWIRVVLGLVKRKKYRHEINLFVCMLCYGLDHKSPPKVYVL